MPEVNDEFAKSLGDYEDVADLRAKLLERLTENRKTEAEAQFTDKAIGALIDGATIGYPPSAVDRGGRQHAARPRAPDQRRRL